MSVDFNKSNKIDSLQALRGGAFLGVFLGHYYVGTVLFWTPISVSVFFILSGFLLTLKKDDRYVNCNLSDSIKIAFKRISSLYPLHIILTLVAVVSFTYSVLYENHVDPVKIFLNIFLLQSLYPDTAYAASLNSVSWFLSSLMILYILYPFIYRALKLLKNVKKMYIAFFITLFMQTAMVFLSLNMFSDENILSYWIHVSPLYRVFEIIYGILLGMIVIEKSNNKRHNSVKFYSVAEVLVFVIIACLLYYWNTGNDFEYFKRAPISPLIATALVYLFYMKKGFITRLLACKPLIMIGNRSGSGFLIHLLASMYFVYMSIQYGNENVRLLFQIVCLVLCFFTTMLLSGLYDTKISPWIKSIPGYIKTHSFIDFAENYLSVIMVFVCFAIRVAIGKFINVWLPASSLSPKDALIYSEIIRNFPAHKIFTSGYPVGYTMLLQISYFTKFSYSILYAWLWGGCGLLGYRVSEKLCSKKIISSCISVYLMFLPCGFDFMCGTKLGGSSLLCPFAVLAFLLLINLVYDFIVTKKKHLFLSLFLLLFISIVLFDFKEASGQVLSDDVSYDKSERFKYVIDAFSGAVMLKGYCPGLMPVSDDELLIYAGVIGDAKTVTNENYLNELYRLSVSPSGYYSFAILTVRAMYFIYRIINTIALAALAVNIALSLLALVLHIRSLKRFIFNNLRHFLLIFISSIILCICLLSVYSVCDSSVFVFGYQNQINLYNPQLPGLLSISYIILISDITLFYKEKYKNKNQLMTGGSNK